MTRTPQRARAVPGPLGAVRMDGELPVRADLGLITANATTRGAGQAYLATYTDADGQWLDGGRDYTLRVPAPVPAKLFWFSTVYAVDTRCLIDNDQGRGDRGSRDPDLRTDDDGSVELYFGPRPPHGPESNWVQTVPGQHWFSYFRLYGPLERYLDRSWKLGDIRPVRA
jgi:hypothetical protein